MSLRGVSCPLNFWPLHLYLLARFGGPLKSFVFIPWQLVLPFFLIFSTLFHLVEGYIFFPFLRLSFFYFVFDVSSPICGDSPSVFSWCFSHPLKSLSYCKKDYDGMSHFGHAVWVRMNALSLLTPLLSASPVPFEPLRSALVTF